MQQRFFTVYEDGSFQTHATAKEAKDEAEAALEESRDSAGDGWSEDVHNICWGRSEEQVTRVSAKKAPEGSPFDELWEFELLPFKEEVAP